MKRETHNERDTMSKMGRDTQRVGETQSEAGEKHAESKTDKE